MSDLRKLTRIILIGLALYILILTGWTWFATMPYMILGGLGDRAGMIRSLSMLLMIVYSLLIVYLAVRKGDFWIRKIVGGDKPVQPPVWWVPFTFRLTAVFTGILYLYWTIPSMLSAAQGYLAARKETPEVARYYFRWERSLGWVILLAVGIYLLYGAPHFVRWQVKKTLEQCTEPADSKDNTS